MKNVHFHFSIRTHADSVYRWCYVRNVNSKAARKAIHFSSMMRRTYAQSDWVSAIWGSPRVPLAPPRKNDPRLALNIDTYINYVDR